MAGIGKDDDGETGQDRDDTLVGHDTDIALETHVITFCKVVNNQDDQITDRSESNDAGILEGVESAEEGERNHDKPDQMSEMKGESKIGRILT
jgi:hypothetical protein